MIKGLFKGFSQQKQTNRQVDLYRNLIRREAKIGGQLFGPMPKGCRREFFCLDEHTWVWHEEWTDQKGQHRTKTTRYDVRPDGILKTQNGQYQQLTASEAQHLSSAVQLYEQKVCNELYAGIA